MGQVLLHDLWKIDAAPAAGATEQKGANVLAGSRQTAIEVSGFGTEGRDTGGLRQGLYSLLRDRIQTLVIQVSGDTQPKPPVPTRDAPMSSSGGSG